MRPHKGHLQAARLCTVILVLALCAVTRAPTPPFAGGTGTAEDPYQIATAEQLSRIGGYGFADKWFVLTADIDCSTTKEGFVTFYWTFDGVLDGNSRVLRNLMIPAKAGTRALFLTLGSRGIIRNLTVENCHIYAESGHYGIGLLCETNQGQILNCHVSNCVVNSTGVGDVGVLAGTNLGLMEDCQAENVTVIAMNDSSPAGGLAGRNLGIMRYCAAQGSLFASGNAGGLVGTNTGQIEGCCASMTVTAEYGDRPLGGLIGINNGRIADCYAAGPVWRREQRGGLVGLHQSGEITRCYSTGQILPSHSYSSEDGGPLVGEGDAASVCQSYYLSVDGLANPVGTLGAPLSPSEMVRRDKYVGWTFFDEDPASLWLTPENGPPRLVWESQQDIPVVAGLDVNEARRVLEQHGWRVDGIRMDYSRRIAVDRVIWTFPSGRAFPGTPIDIVVSQGAFDWSAIVADPNVGTAARPLEIGTAGQLEALRDFAQIENKHIELTGDIDMAGRILSEPLIGVVRDDHAQGVAVNLEGNGFEIRNLIIRDSSTLYVGLVGCLAKSGKITNLGLTRAVITGVMSCGGATGGALVGRNDGVIQGCHVRDFICIGVTGGLVGSNNGTMEKCFSVDGAVSAVEAGGLVEFNAGTIDKCFTDACIVTGGAGLVSWNWGQLTDSYAWGTVLGFGGTLVDSNRGNISCCYATGRVVHDDGSLGFEIVRDQDGGSIADSYYRVPGTYWAPANPVGTPLLDAQMRRRDSFAGWDFWGPQADGSVDIWLMLTDGYPLLTWQCGAGGLPAVPLVLNLDVNEAVSQLQSAGITFAVHYEYDNEVPASQVMRTQAGGAPEQPVVEVIASLGPYSWDDNPGDGSEANPFAISLSSQLASLAEHPELWDQHFVLTADLDLGWLTFSEAVIAPDANVAQAGFQGPHFNGVFDGAGHTLANLTIYSSESYLGLFGALGPTARIAHLHLDNVCIAGSDASRYVGPVAGTSAGTLEDCHASGSIKGSHPVGLLVGDSTGTIKECTSVIVISSPFTPSSRTRPS